MSMTNSSNATIVSKALHKKCGKVTITGDFDRPSNYFAQYKVNNNYYYICCTMPYQINWIGEKNNHPTEPWFILPKDLVDKWEGAPKEYRCLVMYFDNVYDFSMDYVYKHLHTKFPSFYNKNICYKSPVNNPTFFSEENRIKYGKTDEDIYLTNFLTTFQPKPCQYSNHREINPVTILGEEFKSFGQFCELYNVNPKCMGMRKLKVNKPDYSTWTLEDILNITCPINE